MKSVFVRFAITALVVGGVAFGFQNCAEQVPPAGNANLPSPGPGPGPYGPPSPGPIPVVPTPPAPPNPPPPPPPTPGGAPVPNVAAAGLGWIHELAVWIQATNVAADAKVIVTAGGAASPSEQVNPPVHQPEPSLSGGTALQFIISPTMAAYLNSSNGVDIEVLNPTTGARSAKKRLIRPDNAGRLAATRYFKSGNGGTIKPNHWMVVSSVAAAGTADLTSLGYVVEGTIFYGSPRPQGDFTTPLYQCVRSAFEDSTYISIAANCEGETGSTAWEAQPWMYVSDTAGPGKVQLFRCFSGSKNRHFFTTNSAECNATNTYSTVEIFKTGGVYVWTAPN